MSNQLEVDMIWIRLTNPKEEIVFVNILTIDKYYTMMSTIIHIV